MRVRQILYSGPMVRALLNGWKTQTRRIVKPQPRWVPEGEGLPGEWQWNAGYKGKDDRNPKFGMSFTSYAMTEKGFADCIASCAYAACPYGQPGDLLWVRETWQEFFADEIPEGRRDGPRGLMGIPAKPERRSVVVFRADGEIPAHPEYGEANWRPAIFMPRKFSRLTLRLTDVRVERLQEISEADAIAEGIAPVSLYQLDCESIPPSHRFRDLWNSINGPDSWDANPWCWVLSFNVITQNVDEVLAGQGGGLDRKRKGEV